MQIVICDDDRKMQDILRDKIERSCREMGVVCEITCCSSGGEVLGADRAPDVLFLDIQMPELTGLELSGMIGQDVRIIFITAFEQYALDGFKVNALDYLLKPVSYPEFLKAANKALQWFEMKSFGKTSVRGEEDSIFVKSDYKLLKIEFQKICFIEGLKDYVKIFLEDASCPVVSLISMKSLEETLPSASFIRVHRSFIVNLDKVAVVERNRIVFGKTYIPVSDSYRDKFLEFINGKVIK